MKIIAIGDTHGRKAWEQIVLNPADKYVFIGDYFDTHGTETAIQQMRNFDKILAFKENNPGKVVLLIGNHDFHYLEESGTDKYSGYQQAYQEMIQDVLAPAIEKGYMQMAYQADGVLYTHAGLTETWAKNNKFIVEPDGLPWDRPLNLWFKDMPESFKFTSGPKIDPYGDETCQSPIWVRPDSLTSDPIKGVKQVVGHTTQDKILTVNDALFFIDTLGASGEYLEVTDGEAVIKSPI